MARVQLSPDPSANQASSAKLLAGRPRLRRTSDMVPICVVWFGGEQSSRALLGLGPGGSSFLGTSGKAVLTTRVRVSHQHTKIRAFDTRQKVCGYRV